MSIQSEIARIESAKTSIATAIEGKGVTVPDGTLLDGIAPLIESIETGGGGTAYTIGHGLKLDAETNTLSVDTADKMEQDNTLPITSAAVYVEVGNINARVESIEAEPSVQPDWNQNDSTQPDYIKNRPFYTGDPVETVLVEESTVSFAASDGMYMGQLESTFSATVGETYKVYWDGAAYECTCVNFNDMPFIGNLSIIGAGSDTGEPFIMWISNSEGTQIMTADTSASHTFSISGTAAPIVKIPAKFIDKDASGYIVVHNSSTMTEEERENYYNAISKGETAFIIWGSLYISGISVDTETDSTGVSVVYLYVNTPNGESYRIAQNSEGLFNLNDRKLSKAVFPNNKATGDVSPGIHIDNGKIRISSSRIYTGVGTTDALFYVRPNGTKSKSFEVLGNGEAVAPALILYSSTADSTKKFRITVDDSGAITATEVS